MKTRRLSLRLALLGALEFGLVALVPPFLFSEPLPMGSLLALPLAGAVGGGGLAWHIKGWRAIPGAALRFALGFAIAGLIVWFSLISLQASIEPAWGAIAWGFALALGTAIGGRSLRWQAGREPHRSLSPDLAGALGFAFSGALGGWLGFTLFRTMNGRGLDVGMFLALALGGAMFGGTLEPAKELASPDLESRG